MRSFNKALLLAWRHHKWSIVTSLLCSMMVGVLWGANIGAVYPFAEVIFRGQSLHEWVVRETETAQEAIKSGQQKIEELRSAPKVDERRVSIEQQMIDSWSSRLSNVQNWKPYIDAYAPRRPFPTLLVLVGLLLGGTALKCLFLTLSCILMARVSYRTSQLLQRKYFAQVLDLHLGRLADKETGDAASRVGGDIGAIGGAISTLLGRTVREPLKMISCLVGAAYINWRLLILSLLICPIAAYILVSLSKAIKKASIRNLEVQAGLIGFFIQVFQGFYVVKAFGNEELEMRRFEERTEQVYRQQIKLEIYNSLVRSNNEVLGIGMVCLSLIAGGYLVLNQETHIFGLRLANQPMDFGSIMTFYAFLIAASDPIRKLGDVFGAIQSGIAGAERVYAVLSAKPTIVDPPNPVALPEGDIEFRDLSFRYHPNVPVLESMQLTIRQGEKVALVGPNGCGKSTLINLLLRFYDPDQGSVAIGGVDIRHAKQDDLRRRIGLVTQNTMLFSDSIRENIRYAKLDATDEDIYDAASYAKVDSFITSQMSNGYDTACGEQGSSLSGGQRQRIAIARAMLRKPSIFIFDEATSQIDLESERLIHDAFQECVGDNTAIMITHRPAALEIVDRIIVMNAGRIEACGTHAELLKSSSTYYQLYSQEVVAQRQAAA